MDDARHSRLLRQLAKANLLILNHWGPEPLLPEQARDLLEIFEDRYDAGSTLITSQVPVDRWYEIIGIPPLPMPSSTGCCTTLTALNSRREPAQTQCGRARRLTCPTDLVILTPDPRECPVTGQLQIGPVAGFASE